MKNWNGFGRKLSCPDLFSRLLSAETEATTKYLTVAAEIRTDDLPNKSLERRRFASLLWAA
jgi:hypothetical protein